MGTCGSKKDDRILENGTSQINTASASINQQRSQNNSTEADILDDVEDYLREPELISPTPNRLYDESELLDKSIHQNLCKPRKAAFRRNSKDRRSSTDSGIVDAWKQKKGIPKHTLSENNNKPDQISINESEYGKEGIDLVSTVEPAQQNFGPIGNRSSPDGGRDFEHSTAPRLYKEESDETFDPTTLVDIEKFKAANFPSLKAKADENVEYQTQKEKGFGVDEDIPGASIQYSDRVADRGTGHRSLQRPSDIYNDDERALMESIEKDFVQMSLPGAVA